MTSDERMKMTAVPEWVVGRQPATRRFLQDSGALTAGLLAILVVALLALAFSEGGRSSQTLAVVQILFFLLAIVCVSMTPFRPGRASMALAAVIAMMAITAAWSVRADSSIRTILLWLMYLAVVLTVSSTLTGWRRARRFSDGIIAVGGVLCLAGLYLFWGAEDPHSRWASTFYSPNAFATFLLLVFPLTAFRACLARTRREVIDYGAMATLQAMALFLTLSRGAYLTLAAVGVMAVLIIPRQSRWPALRRMALIAVVAAVVASGLIRAPGAVLTRTASTFDAGSSSVLDRLSFWHSSVRVFLDHPAVGTGPGTFAYVHPQYLGRYYSRDAHNFYVQMLAEMGMVGLAAVALLVAALGSLGVRGLRLARGREEYPLVAGALVSLVAFFLHSGIEMSWQFPAIPAMAFALVGFLEWSARVIPPPDHTGQSGARSPSSVRGATIGALALGALAAFILQTSDREFVIGRDLTRTGNWSDASGRFRRAMTYNPVDPRLPSAQATALLRTSGDLQSAVSLIRQAASLDRMNAYYRLQLAEALYSNVQDSASLQEVEAHLSAALRLDPLHYPEAYTRLAQVYAKQERLRDARRVYEDAVSFYSSRVIAGDTVLRVLLWPRVWRLFSRSAAFMAAQGDADAAVHVLDEILRQDPGWQPAYRQITNIYRNVGRYNDAHLAVAAARAQLPDQLALSMRFPRQPGVVRQVYPR